MDSVKKAVMSPVNKIREALREGLTPQEVALSVACGIACGIFPLCGTQWAVGIAYGVVSICPPLPTLHSNFCP